MSWNVQNDGHDPKMFIQLVQSKLKISISQNGLTSAVKRERWQNFKTLLTQAATVRPAILFKLFCHIIFLWSFGSIDSCKIKVWSVPKL